MDDIKRRLAIVEKSLIENTEITAEIRDIMSTAKTGFRVLGWIGIAAKWLATMSLAISSVYGVWYAITHGGKIP